MNLTKQLDKIRESKRFHTILEITLALTNYLNGEGPKGGASGIKLDTIQKIEEIKTEDKKDNLAFYMVRKVWNKYPFPIFAHN